MSLEERVAALEAAMQKQGVSITALSDARPGAFDWNIERAHGSLVRSDRIYLQHKVSIDNAVLRILLEIMDKLEALSP